MSRRLAMAVIMVAAAAANSLAATYYVSPHGQDTNSGLGPGPGKALRTIQAGVNKLQPGDTLLIRGGVYRETVVFSRSGTADRPITVRSYQNEKVVISGCDEITGWQRHEGPMWKAPMPWTLGPGRNQVFMDGRVMIEARFPNEPAPGLEMPVADLSPLWPTFGEFSIPQETRTSQSGRVVSKLLEGQPDDYWKGAIYYGVHYEGWCAQTGIIESSKSGEIIVGDRTRGWWFGPAYGGGYPAEWEEGRGMIVGHIHALDQPGEWVWMDNTLYFIPPGGKPRNVEAKRRQLAFDLSGCEHIRIEGITVTAASLRMEDSAHCTFERCDFSYVSHFTHQYASGQVAEGRDTIKSGETGIYVGGHDNAFISCSVRYSAGAGFHLRGYHHTIHNCLIDEVSYTAHYLNAITDAVSDFGDYEDFLVGGHVITFNTMRNAGRHFFNFYGNGPSLASRTRSGMDYMATLFAHNHLYNGMLLTRDAGFVTGYYCSAGTLNGLNSQVAYNVMHDNFDIFAMRINALGPIYLDAGTCNVDVHHNLLWAAPGTVQRSIWFNTCCANCTDHENIFHPEFTRTCAALRPEDFPGGQPFRFGHDFDNPPPIPKWPQIESQVLEAEKCALHSASVRTMAGGVENLADGDWVCLGPVDFDRGWQSAVLRFASDVAEMNTDKSSRQRPRHQKATDPLVLEATARDGASEGVTEQWTFIRGVRDGSWIRFNNVPLGEGYERLRVVYGKVNDVPASVEMRLDSADGPVVATAALRRTDRDRGGNIQIYGEALGEVAPQARGTHDVFFVFNATDERPVGEFEYFRLERYRGDIPLAANEAKIELRIDGSQGEKIGVVYPHCTGGPERYCQFVATLEPVRGQHELYLVVRSALEKPVGAIDWLRLDRAAQPQDLSFLGASPLRDKQGHLMFPRPTHRPRSRPADKYGHTAASGRPPAPVIVAQRLDTPPHLDGKVEEWAHQRGVKLQQAQDGYESLAPASAIWVAYDDQALYVAAEHPLQPGKRLTCAGHRYGSTDCMELAVQVGLSDAAGPVIHLCGWPDGHFVATDLGGAPQTLIGRVQKSATYRAAGSEKAWTCEWRLPFAACGFTPETAPIVRFNAGVRRTGESALVALRGTGGRVYEGMTCAALVALSDELGGAKLLPREGLEVWLDAADAATIETDEAGRVVRWKDKSGKGRHAAQERPEFRPFYATDGLNGRPALRFDEERATRMELPDLAEGKITATIFAVASNPEPGLPVNHDPRIFTASDGEGFDYLIGLCCTIPGMQTGGPRIISTVQTDRWAKYVRIGCFSPIYQTFLKGYVGEVIVYSRALTAEETGLVRAYLTAKWQLE